MVYVYRQTRFFADHRSSARAHLSALRTTLSRQPQDQTFFEWIKQYLRIKVFYGTTQNAVKTQMWIAVSVYVLVAIIKNDSD
jgi:hypothetical protein